MDEPKKTRRKKAAPKILHCSFCEKSQHEVRKLIAKGGDFTNPSVLICDECIDLCNDIIEEEAAAKAPESREAYQAYITAKRDAMQTLIDRIVAATTKYSGNAPHVGNTTRH